MDLPPVPGSGSYPLTLETPAFYVLAGLLACFALMLWYLSRAYPRRKRGLEGYFEAAGIDLAFLCFGLVLVVGLVAFDDPANRTAWALYRVILGGYWLTFAIPVVTVASSVESRSRGKIPWMWPSLFVATVMFGALWAYYFYAG